MPVVKIGVSLQAVTLQTLPAVLVFKDGTYYTYSGETDFFFVNSMPKLSGSL